MPDNNRNNSRQGGGPRGGGGRRGGVERPKDAKGTFARLLKYFVPYKWSIIGAMFCLLLSSLASVASNYFLKPVINDIIVPIIGKEDPDLTAFIQMLIVMGIIYAVGSLASYFQSRLLTDMAADVQEKIRYELFEHMQDLPISYYDTHSTGDLMSRFTNDLGTIRQMISQSLPQLISSVVTFVGIFAIMLFLNWKLMLIVIAILFVTVYCISFISKHSVSYFIKQQRITGEVNGYIQEMIDGAKVVKVFVHEDTVIKDFNDLNDQLFDCSTRAQFLGGIMWPVTGNIGYLQYAILSVVGAGMVISGSTDVGTIGSFLQYSRTINQPPTR